MGPHLGRVARHAPVLGPAGRRGDVVRIDRPYARFDSAALRARMRERCAASEVRLERGSALSVAHDRAGSVVTDARGRPHAASVVIDATGRGVLLRRRGAPSHWQTAWGVLAEVDGWSGPPRWMDFAPVDAAGPPTFLYALPMPDGRVFLEETALVRSPRVPRSILEPRLHRRLAAMGLRLRAVHEAEDCAIPMDTPLPSLRQRVVGFGAAAGMIHPATGYLLARALRTAPSVAEALRDGLASGPDAAARGAWRAIWPGARIRTRRLHVLGARMLAKLDAVDTRRFFGAFFSLPASVRDAWLDDTLPIGALAAGMVDLFRRVPAGVRWRLVAGSLAAAPEISMEEPCTRP